jgi:hypothetical protein
MRMDEKREKKLRMEVVDTDGITFSRKTFTAITLLTYLPTYFCFPPRGQQGR